MEMVVVVVMMMMMLSFWNALIYVYFYVLRCGIYTCICIYVSIYCTVSIYLSIYLSTVLSCIYCIYLTDSLHPKTNPPPCILLSISNSRPFIHPPSSNKPAGQMDTNVDMDMDTDTHNRTVGMYEHGQESQQNHRPTFGVDPDRPSHPNSPQRHTVQHQNGYMQVVPQAAANSLELLSASQKAWFGSPSHLRTTPGYARLLQPPLTSHLSSLISLISLIAHLISSHLSSNHLRRLMTATLELLRNSPHHHQLSRARKFIPPPCSSAHMRRLSGR